MPDFAICTKRCESGPRTKSRQSPTALFCGELTAAHADSLHPALRATAGVLEIVHAPTLNRCILELDANTLHRHVSRLGRHPDHRGPLLVNRLRHTLLTIRVAPPLSAVSNASTASTASHPSPTSAACVSANRDSSLGGRGMDEQKDEPLSAVLDVHSQDSVTAQVDYRHGLRRPRTRAPRATGGRGDGWQEGRFELFAWKGEGICRCALPDSLTRSRTRRLQAPTPILATCIVPQRAGDTPHVICLLPSPLGSRNFLPQVIFSSYASASPLAVLAPRIVPQRAGDARASVGLCFAFKHTRGSLAHASVPTPVPLRPSALRVYIDHHPLPSAQHSPLACGPALCAARHHSREDDEERESPRRHILRLPLVAAPPCIQDPRSPQRLRGVRCGRRTYSLMLQERVGKRFVMTSSLQRAGSRRVSQYCPRPPRAPRLRRPSPSRVAASSFLFRRGPQAGNRARARRSSDDERWRRKLAAGSVAPARPPSTPRLGTSSPSIALLLKNPPRLALRARVLRLPLPVCARSPPRLTCVLAAPIHAREHEQGGELNINARSHACVPMLHVLGQGHRLPSSTSIFPLRPTLRAPLRVGVLAVSFGGPAAGGGCGVRCVSARAGTRCLWSGTAEGGGLPMTRVPTPEPAHVAAGGGCAGAPRCFTLVREQGHSARRASRVRGAGMRRPRGRAARAARHTGSGSRAALLATRWRVEMQLALALRRDGSGS
ncbi:hypothetical protein C8R44DRAFT_890097 [Mycena epipterygia]|nr:hypothetical protein C8R44DRAFT_890097 [Mycena epipterygia]